MGAAADALEGRCRACGTIWGTHIRGGPLAAPRPRRRSDTHRAPHTHPTANATKPTDNAEKMEIAARKISDSREGEKPRKNEHRGYYTHRRNCDM